MLKNQSLDKLALIAGLTGIFILPQLNNVHYDPQPQFWAEITAAWAMLGMFIIALYNLKKVTIPSIVIPLFLFAGYLLIQPFLVTVDFPGLSYVTALEMVVCIFFAIAINSYKEKYSLAYLVQIFCYILLIGSILQTLIGFIQYSGNYSHFGDLIFYDSDHPTTNIFGHFGQRNHYAHYLTWGTFALIYLYVQRKLPANIFYTLIIWLSFSITIAASRSVLIYFPAAVIICLVYYFLKRDYYSKRLLFTIVISTFILFAMEYLYPLVHHLFTSHNNISSGLERISADSGTGRRGVEWEKAWLVFKSHPIFGFGWNEYAKESVLLHHLFPKAPPNSGLFTNCHNLILQLMAETGVIGTIIVVFGVVIGIYRTIKADSSVNTIILLCMLSTTLIHSMNEYPLWYMYFLAGFIMFLSMDKPICTINTNILSGISATPLLLIIYLMIRGSFIFDKMVDYYDTPDDQKTFISNANYLQNLVDHNILWSYFAIYSLDNYINVDTAYTNALFSTAIQLQYTSKFDQFHPYPDTLIKEAMLQWNMGNKEKAKQLVETAVVAFPVYKKSFQDTLKAKKYQELKELSK
jgi:O-antigen ligase